MFLIFGYGTTGRSLKRYMNKMKIPYIIVDDTIGGNGGILKPHEAMGILDKVEGIILSPGIPMDHPFLERAREKGIRIEGDIEFAFKRMEKNIPIVAITGTNGKTTTTHLLGEILKESGKRVFVGGNVGRPFIELFFEKTPEVVVLELSSFQLEKINSFRPHVAVLLNITPDHIREHGSFARYAMAKLRIFKNQSRDDWAVIMDPEWCKKAPVRSRALAIGRDILIDQEKITIRCGKTLIIHRNRLKLLGFHNAVNVASASAASMIIGVNSETIISAVENFRGLPHRLEPVGELHGIRFFNDSKATNLDAVTCALKSLPPPINLIMGGILKDEDLGRLVPELVSKVKAVFLFGESGPVLEKKLGDRVPTTLCRNLEDAFREATKDLLPGQTVLLSPGGSSFDQFKNYEERGNLFKQLVREWIRKNSN